MGTAGQLIVKRYRLTRALGQGSTGVVWEGRDTLLDRPVAIREILLPSGLRAARRMELNQRVAREARQAERLQHPGIARVYDVAEEGEVAYIVMELVRSRSLDGVVAGDGPLPAGRAAAVGRQILAALIYAHAAGVRHGDVRPANVLIGHDGRVLLADFGVGTLSTDPAFLHDTPERAPAHGRPVSATRGAAAFLAPERREERGLPGADLWAGGAPSVAGDLWSLGATLHLALTGRPPGRDNSGRESSSRESSGHDDLQAIPEPLRPLVRGLLAKDPRKRLTAEAAQQMLAELEPAAPPPAKTRRGGRTRLVTVVAAVSVIAGAIGGWAVLRPATGGPGTLPLAGAAATASAPPATAPAPTPSPVRAARLKLKWHTAATGWRAGVPKDWTLEETEYATRWLDPAGRAQLMIEVTAQSGTDPLGALREAEAILYPTVKAYQKLRLKTVSSRHGTAADWEFTWRQRKNALAGHLVKGAGYHQFRRVIATGTTTSVLTWTTMAADWDRLRPTLSRVLRLYQPPTQP